jgi:hypothetical protein
MLKKKMTFATNGLGLQMVEIILMNLRRMISLLTKFSLESSTGNCKIFFLLFFKHVFVALLLVTGGDRRLAQLLVIEQQCFA